MTAYYFFDKIIWSPDGQHYALPLNTKLMVYNVETAGIAYTIEDNQKIHGVTFLTVIQIIFSLFKICRYYINSFFVPGAFDMFWLRKWFTELS